MGQYIQDLFTVAMGGGSIQRYGEMAVLVLPGAALVTTREDIQKAQRWARGRNTTGSEDEDRRCLLAQLETLIARGDYDCLTRGASDTLARLAKRMRDNGMDLQAWRIPQPVLDALPAATATSAA